MPPNCPVGHSRPRCTVSGHKVERRESYQSVKSSDTATRRTREELRVDRC